MYAPLKLGIYLLGAVILLGLLSPLIVFTLETLTNPGVIMFRIKSAKNIDEEHYSVTISLVYNGTVTLYDVQVIIGNKTILTIPKLENGKEYITTINITKQDLKVASNGYILRFNIGGLYDFKYSVKKVEKK